MWVFHPDCEEYFSQKKAIVTLQASSELSHVRFYWEGPQLVCLVPWIAFLYFVFLHLMIIKNYFIKTFIWLFFCFSATQCLLVSCGIHADHTLSIWGHFLRDNDYHHIICLIFLWQCCKVDGIVHILVFSFLRIFSFEISKFQES